MLLIVSLHNINMRGGGVEPSQSVLTPLFLLQGEVDVEPTSLWQRKRNVTSLLLNWVVGNVVLQTLNGYLSICGKNSKNGVTSPYTSVTGLVVFCHPRLWRLNGTTWKEKKNVFLIFLQVEENILNGKYITEKGMSMLYSYSRLLLFSLFFSQLLHMWSFS